MRRPEETAYRRANISTIARHRQRVPARQIGPYVVSLGSKRRARILGSQADAPQVAVRTDGVDAEGESIVHVIISSVGIVYERAHNSGDASDASRGFA